MVAVRCAILPRYRCLAVQIFKREVIRAQSALTLSLYIESDVKAKRQRQTQHRERFGREVCWEADSCIYIYIYIFGILA